MCMCKVQLILVDGMRPDALAACKNPYVNELLENSLYTLKAQTVMPSVTLPCHMSLFHSVEPGRHGITTNTYMPMARPVDGICERVRKGGKKPGLYYNWEELKDLARPDSLANSVYYSGHCYGYAAANPYVANEAIRAINELGLDFTFTYFGWSDEAGHNFGWMGEEYLHAVHESWNCIRKMVESAPEDCITIITADHGGHDRAHGTDMPEDMLIPVILHGKGLKGELEGDVSIMDIAPTIVKLLGCECAPEWEGKSLL
ncbi:MAG: hypothetical protein E7335_04410 [Clostridiales bacterium]|nr:hypothetical protein [Clostridiales bacterium]